MSKFLKFIVHLIVICAIVCALALVLPPFFGVTTYVVDDASIKTNLPMGSVTYAIPVKAEEIESGAPILVQEDSSTYRYEIYSLDTSNGTGSVLDPTVTDAQYISVTVKDYVPKVVITIAYLGYLQVATKSMEGLIILALVVVFLIILYIIAELWKKSDDREYNYEVEEEAAEVYTRSRKEQKRADLEREKQLIAQEQEMRSESRGRKAGKDEKRKVRTGGFVEEIDEEDDEAEPVRGGKTPRSRDLRSSLRSEIAAATSEAAPEQKRLMDEDEEMEIHEEQEVDAGPVMTSETAEPEEEAPAPRKKLTVKDILEEELGEQKKEEAPRLKRAIPGQSASQISDQARAQGDKPDIIKDDVTDVTIFDYSDII